MTTTNAIPWPCPIGGSSGAPLLRATDVAFRYRRNLAPVFKHFSTTVNAGAHVALTGPSGSGKSTLLYVLAGLMRPMEGQIDFQGQPLRCAAGVGSGQRPFGFVFQQAELDNKRTALECVMEPGRYTGLSLSECKTRALGLLKAVGLASRAHHRPMQLSGGQCQRVAVARALLLRPSIVFADEPTGNLDSDTASIVLDALESLVVAPSALIIATHDPRVVKRATEVVQL